MRKYILSAFVALVAFFALQGAALAEKMFTISLKGMHCPMCKVAISKAIKQVEGVKEVSVYEPGNTARVLAEDNVNKKEILKKIEEAGPYKGHIIEVEENF